MSIADLHTPLDDHWLAELVHVPRSAKPRRIDSKYIRAEKDPKATAWSAFDLKPSAQYDIWLRRATPFDLGMNEIKTKEIER